MEDGILNETPDLHTTEDNTRSLNDLFDEETWMALGKNLNDFDEDDMKMLTFGSYETCTQFYKLYAKVKGFGIRIQQTRCGKKTGLPVSTRIVCNREGNREPKHMDKHNRKRKPKRITRCGCQAEMRFKYCRNNRYWVVYYFKADHNHHFYNPIDVVFDRSHRTIPDGDKICIKTLRDAGVPTRTIMRNMVQQKGSYENVGYLVKDVYNLTHEFDIEPIKDGDSESVMAYLAGKLQADPSFFVRYTRDEDNRLDKLFWCDGTSRVDYKTFGHVLVFDTTYKCNAYRKPFVMLVGVNHHRMTVPFGCALVVSESTETFTWILEQMILAGDGAKPLTVITDGDKAMASAIERVLPGARHRLCLWHLMRNVRANGGFKFASGFMKCVDKYRTPTDFEKGWNELLNHYGVKDKQWARELDADKQKWAEAYLRGFYFAGMRSTQRCESMHHSVKSLLNKRLMLYEFVRRYDDVLKALRFSVSNQEYRTMHSDEVIERGPLTTIKLNASKIYTSKSYDTICKEMSFEAMYIVKHHAEQSGAVYYWLNNATNVDAWYVVIHHHEKDVMHCCCMKFESVGYPCRHMFAVMKYDHMTRIPTGCILRRWTIGAKESNDAAIVEEGDNGGEASRLARYALLSSLSDQINVEAANDVITFQKTKDDYAKQLIYLGQLKAKSATNGSHQQPIGVKDPAVLRERGPTKGKKKVCGSCQMPGHTQRTCQGKQKRTGFDLNNNPTSSSPTSPTSMKASNISQTENFSTVTNALMDIMPSTYVEGEASQVAHSPIVEEMETNKIVVDWDPDPDW